jgi:5'-nucleotidase
MKVLVTNDDGVASAGLHALARAVADAGHEVVVVAPDSEQSGTGAGIGLVRIDRPIDAEPVELPGLDGIPCFAIAGPPGLCVLAARLGGFGTPPDLVVAGINPGCNTGRAVLHSGTVGAALTAANFGVSGLAVSLDVSSRLLHEQAGAAGAEAAGPDREIDVGGGVVADVVDAPGVDGEDDVVTDITGREVGGVAHWQTAATFGARFAGWVLDAPVGTVLNVNVPNLPLDEVAGVRLGDLAPFGTVRTGVVEPATADNKVLQLELRRTTDELPPESDSGLVNRGFVSVTPLQGITVDVTADLRSALDIGPPSGWGAS